MEVIQVNRETYIQLKLGGAIWWEQTETTATGKIGGIVEVQYWSTPADVYTFECIITQIIRTANSNKYVYRLVSNK